MGKIKDMAQNITIPNLTDTQKTFQTIMQNQIVLDTAVNDLQDRTTRHQKILVEGNGDIPLVEKVRNLEEFVDSVKYWLKFLVGALIIQTIAFGTSVVIAVVRFLPVLEKLASQP